MKVVDVFQNISEEERRRRVTEILIQIENKKSTSPISSVTAVSPLAIAVEMDYNKTQLK